MNRLFGVGLLSCALGLAACGGGNSAAPPAGSAGSSQAASSAGGAPSQLQAIIDGAAKEGQLNFVWGEGTEGGSEGIQKLAAGFNRAYGLNVKVQFTPGGSMPDMSSKMISELQTKRPATSDVTIGYAVHMAADLQNGALEPVQWQSWAPNIQNAAVIAANGAAIAFETSVAGIGYNTQKVTGASVPKSLQDLLKPEFKGRIASTPYAANFDYLAMDGLWGEQKTVDYIKQLAKQVVGLIRCDEDSRLMSGEFDLFALTCSQSIVYRDKVKGGPVDFVVPSDAPLLIPLYVGVPKNSAHPNASKLWINYLMSPEAQKVLFDYDQEDAQPLPGSQTAQLLQSLQAAGVKLTQVDISVVQAQDTKEYNRRRTELQNILAGKG
jgi:ABC-type Fe3+ transport system substrate-binding protein